MGTLRARRFDRGGRGRRAALLVSAIGLLGLAGCGSDAKAPGESADPKAEKVTIEHRFGETEVVVAPKRIVSLDVQWTDVLIALDAAPVGYLLDPSVEGGNFPWRGDALDDATGMTATDALPYEQIKDLKPDLIVVSYFAEDEVAYEQLKAIAPTITTLTDRQVDTWQDQATAAGRFLDKADEAKALIEDVDGQAAAVAAELPGLAGKTAALVNYVPGDQLVVVSDPEDGAVVLFDQLGLSIPDEILEAGDGTSGRVELSLEQTGLLEGADLLVLLANDGDPRDLVGWDDLPAVQAGAVSLVDYADVTGLNTPTPLSIPYCLEVIRPALEAAAG